MKNIVIASSLTLVSVLTIMLANYFFEETESGLSELNAQIIATIGVKDNLVAKND